MKKFTLCLSLLAAGAASAFAAADTMPEVSKGYDDAKVYAIVNYRGWPMGQATVLAVDDWNSQAKGVNELTKDGMWYLLEGDEEDTYLLCNYGFYLDDTDAPLGANKELVDLTDPTAPAPQNWYIKPNEVNACGLAISTEYPFGGTSCLDLANHAGGGEGALSAGWSPTAGGDGWRGLTWIFVEVDPDAPEAENWAKIEAAFNDSHAAAIKPEAYETLDALMGMSPWTDEVFSACRKEIEDLQVAFDADLDEVQAEINTMISDAQAEAIGAVNDNIGGKCITIQNVRRLAGEKLSFLGASEVTVPAVVDPDSGEETTPATTAIRLNTFFEAYSYCLWNVVAAEGGVYLQNNATKQYIQGPNVYNAALTTTETLDEATLFTIGMYTTNNPGVTFAYTIPATEEGAEPINTGINVDSGTSVAVDYNPNDGGSTWKVAVADPSGIQTIEAAEVNAEGPVTYFNLQGIQVNPEAVAPGLYIRRQGNTATKVIIR